MGQKDLPCASGAAHVKAFQYLGWQLIESRRGRGSHFLLKKVGHEHMLSIPDHREVKRQLLATQVRLAGLTSTQYAEAFAQVR